MTAVPIRPRSLIAHALETMDPHRGAAGRPRPIWLRRAVSDAYYAVFHDLAMRTVAQLAPDIDEDERYRLTRSIDHQRLGEVCSWISGAPGAGRQHTRPIVDRLQTHKRIKRIADIVGRLREARHRADYDHLAEFDKATTLSLVQQAGRVLDLLESLGTDRDLQRFLSLIALNAQQLR